MRELLIGAGLVLVLGSPLQAQTAAPPPAAAPAPETITVTGKLPDGHKRVCQTSAQTGSILIKRVCKTKQEWEDIRLRSIAALERIKRQEERDAHTRATMSQAE
jgi:hypothetical protein